MHDAAEIPAYEGPHEIPGIRFRHARRILGVSAWGMNVLELQAGCTDYPEHDHVHDGQEEVYVVLRGRAVLHADGQRHPLPAGSMVRVPPEVRRSLTTDEGALLLALGGTPGAIYRPEGET
ncbi:MAG TPA: cupin domain-containing protein [Deltaproteobacteria bacterium]|nr:cupin domain-containing protein [Deltaproteobacteria bacterium]